MNSTSFARMPQRSACRARRSRTELRHAGPLSARQERWVTTEPCLNVSMHTEELDLHTTKQTTPSKPVRHHSCNGLFRPKVPAQHKSRVCSARQPARTDHEDSSSNAPHQSIQFSTSPVILHLVGARSRAVIASVASLVAWRRATIIARAALAALSGTSIEL